MDGVSKRKLKKRGSGLGRKNVRQVTPESKGNAREIEKAIRKSGNNRTSVHIGPSEVNGNKHANTRWMVASGIFSLLLTVLCFGASLTYPMVFDDHHSIAENHYIRDIGNIPAFFTRPEMFSNEPGRRMFRPIVSATYALNYAISGSNTDSYHLVSYIFHALNGFLVFLLLEKIFRSSSLAFFLSLIFVAHPVCVESVVYLSARSTVMASSFLFASLYFFLRYAEKVIHSKAIIVSIIFFVCGLLCKENLIMLAPITLLWGKLLEKSSHHSHFIKSFLVESSSPKKPLHNDTSSVSPFRGKVAVYLPFWGVALAYLFVRKFLLNLSSLVVSMSDRTFGEHIITQTEVWLKYLGKILFPIGLNNQEAVPIARLIGKEGIGVSEQPLWWIILWVLLAWVVYSLRRKREFLMGVAFAGLILLPETITAMNQLYNERRIYMPLFGVLMAVGALSGELKKERTKTCCVLLCIILMCVMSFSRTRAWRDEKTLWFDSIRKSPSSEINWHGLGYLYEQEGKESKALWALGRALANNPTYAPSLRLYGAILLKQNKPKEALVYLDRAMKIEKQSHKGWYNLGLAFYKIGEVGKAEIAFKNAIVLNQFYSLPHYMLAKVYWDRGDRNRALKEIGEAIRRDPQNKLYLEYKDYLLGKNFNKDEAIEERVE